MLAVLSFLLFLAVAAGQPSSINDVAILDPEEIKAGIDAGEYDVILDVRGEDEWDIGHIEGATLALNLASFPSTTIETASPSDFAGCESCTIVVYCRSGARATVALQNLIAAGFNGTLYNGQGTSQWENAGYTLVNDDSVVPLCSSNEVGQCAASNTVAPESPNTSPSMGATDSPTPPTNPTLPPSVGSKEIVPVTLEPAAFKEGIDAGEYDAIIDVRRQDEWDSGHIEGAIFALNLAIFGDPTRATASPADFMGCETCTIVVYCRSGARAAAALENLIAAGFNGTLYNGQGVSQWQAAGYSLVYTDSVVPPCTKSDIGTCVADATTEPVATMIPTKIADEETADSGSKSMRSWSTAMLATLLSAHTVL